MEQPSPQLLPKLSALLLSRLMYPRLPAAEKCEADGHGLVTQGSQTLKVSWLSAEQLLQGHLLWVSSLGRL